MDRFGAAAVIIGNEVLSAKVEEQNGAHLIKRLKERGIALRHVSIVPDEVDAIVEAVARARSVAEHVFTSGGIGPTHDDITVRAVALALGRRVVRLPEMVALLHEHYGDEVSLETLRMAEAPEGATLHRQEGIWYPLLACDGVYMLPGVPQLFRIQLETVLKLIPGRPLTLKMIYLSVGESAIARSLDEVALRMPHVAIGSYPTFDAALDYRVKVTLEGERAEAVQDALGRLLELLPKEAVVRLE